MSIEVRDAAASDASAWRALFAAYGAFYETAFDEATLDRVWTLLREAGSGVDALVAESGGAVVGLAHYRSHPDTFSGGRDWYLDDLFVAPDARGAGVATALIEAITERARAAGGFSTLRWITAENNVRAQRLYDRIARRTTWVTYERDA
ncbi:MAG: GNAT family N-acetyltransferase [Micrococcales bacterium]|nr:GNAT family N-acetyltransferase [Micrococcales bacterium]